MDLVRRPQSSYTKFEPLVVPHMDLDLSQHSTCVEGKETKNKDANVVG